MRSGFWRVGDKFISDFFEDVGGTRVSQADIWEEEYRGESRCTGLLRIWVNCGVVSSACGACMVDIVSIRSTYEVGVR